MATLTVWKFDSPTAADETIAALEALSKQELITLHDAATVSWPEAAKKPKTRQLTSLVAGGALGGMFWGMLFGLLFLIPLVGAAIGAATGAVAGSLRDVGIDDDFIRAVRDELTPGTSALFVLSSDAVVEKIKDAFIDLGHRPVLLRSNLTAEQEATVRDMFAAE